MRANLRGGETWVALGAIAFGLFLMEQTAQIEVTASYARVGPRVFPWIMSSVLVLLGVGLLREALSGRWRITEAEGVALPPIDKPALLWLLIGLALYLVTVGYGGFPIATGLLFAAAARGFGSRRIAIDLVLGLVIGIVIYIGFHHGLGLTLPAGILESILG